jgi:NDP-sugar pyrophosphorylase family protein
MQCGSTSIFQEMSAAILAGGLGTRLRPAVSDRSKVVAEVKGRPFLAWLFDFLERSGLRNVVLCTGYKGDGIEREFGLRYGELSIVHSRESTPLGTGGALRQALPFLRSGTVLVLNGDSYCDLDLPEFFSAHLARAALASLALAWTEDTRRFGRVEMQEHDRIAEFLEKGNAEGPGWISAGIYLIQRELIEEIPSNTPLSLEREIFPTWIPQGAFGFKTTGQFIDIGTPESYALANRVLFEECLITG